MGEGELRRKRLGKEIALEPRVEHTMRQVDSRFRTDKGPDGNEEVCSTTEVQYAEKNG